MNMTRRSLLVASAAPLTVHAREHIEVVIYEYDDHIGVIVSNGLTAIQTLG
jgi:hypothetical protein